MPAQLTVWPGLDPSGTSLEVLAEDGVTVIQPILGATVYYTAYYQRLLATGQLLTYNPLETSGDSVEIPPYLKVTGAQVGVLTSALDDLTPVLEGAVVETTGDIDEGDGGSDVFTAQAAGTPDGYRLIAAPSGNWRRGSIDARSRINILKFGFRSTADYDNSDAMDSFLEFCMSANGLTFSNTDRPICGFVPLTRYGFLFSRPIEPPGGNRYTMSFEGEGFWACANKTRGQNASYTDPTQYGSSMFRAAPDVDVFRMESFADPETGPGWVVAASLYRRLYLKNLTLITSGAGFGIGMRIPDGGPPNDIVDAQGGALYTENVQILGAECGMQINTFESGHHTNLTIRGCEVAVRIGATNNDVAGGVNGAYFLKPDIQACNVGLEILRGANNTVFEGGLWQGLDTIVKVGPYGGGRNIAIRNAYSEVYDYWLDIDSSVTNIGLRFENFTLGAEAGDSAASTVDLKNSNGIVFDSISDTASITFLGTNSAGGASAIFRDCRPGNIHTAVTVTPSRKWVIECDNVMCAPNNGTWNSGGSFVMDYLSGSSSTGGRMLTRELQSDMLIGLLLSLPVGPEHEVTLSLYQGGAGGFAVTFNAGIKGQSRYSNTGNVAGTRCYIRFQRLLDGNVYITGFEPWSAEA